MQNVFTFLLCGIILLCQNVKSSVAAATGVKCLIQIKLYNIFVTDSVVSSTLAWLPCGFPPSDGVDGRPQVSGNRLQHPHATLGRISGVENDMTHTVQVVTLLPFTRIKHAGNYLRTFNSSSCRSLNTPRTCHLPVVIRKQLRHTRNCSIYERSVGVQRVEKLNVYFFSLMAQ